MKIRLVWFILFFFVLSGQACFASVAELPEIVAKVGNISLSKYELVRETRRLIPKMASFHGGVSKELQLKTQADALESLIEQSYKVLYAIEKEISISNSAVDERLTKVREKFKTDDELRNALGGESIEDFRASVYRMLLAKKAESVAVNEKAEVSEEELRQKYEQSLDMYMRPQQYRVQHILVKVDPTLIEKERQKLLDKANGLLEKAKAGEDFYNLAYYNSDEPTKFVGGDTGYFHSGQVVKEFEDAIKDLQPGDIVGPVETLAGFHVIKLTDKKPPHQMAFDEVADKIRTKVEGERRAALKEKWIAELADKYQVEVFID